MSLFALAPAKVNLNLHILGKTDQGYHLLDSLVVFTDFGDEIHIQKSDETNYIIKGQYAFDLLMDENNLIVKAHRALEAIVKKPLLCKITLVKKLPTAAGVGGGSSDGATTLKLINQIFELNIPMYKLGEIGLSLGADFPVCLHGKSCFMGGVGEKITPISSFPELHIALINPKKATPTKRVFSLLKHTYSSALSYRDYFEREELFQWLGHTHNDLQKPAISLVPEIESILQKLQHICSEYPSLLSHYGMSGSGATCYIISPSNILIYEALKLFNAHEYILLKGKIS